MERCSLIFLFSPAEGDTSLYPESLRNNLTVSAALNSVFTCFQERKALTANTWRVQVLGITKEEEAFQISSSLFYYFCVIGNR